MPLMPSIVHSAYFPLSYPSDPSEVELKPENTGRLGTAGGVFFLIGGFTYSILTQESIIYMSLSICRTDNSQAAIPKTPVDDPQTQIVVFLWKFMSTDNFAALRNFIWNLKWNILFYCIVICTRIEPVSSEHGQTTFVAVLWPYMSVISRWNEAHSDCCSTISFCLLTVWMRAAEFYPLSRLCRYIQSVFHIF